MSLRNANRQIPDFLDVHEATQKELTSLCKLEPHIKKLIMQHRDKALFTGYSASKESLNAEMHYWDAYQEMPPST